MRHKRKQRAQAAIITAAMLGAWGIASSAYAAGWVHSYAGNTWSTNVAGIDGYIRTSTTTTLSTSQGHAHFINLSTTGGGYQQLGQYQGSAWVMGVPAANSAVHRYYENNGVCGYVASDLGTPVAGVPNEAYYITIGSSYAMYCASTMGYRVSFRIGTYTSTPVAYGYAPTLSGQPIAETEVVVFGAAPYPPIGVDRFGLDHAGSVNSGYALHLLPVGSTTWNLWTSGRSFANNPPYYQNKTSYSAFTTSKT